MTDASISVASPAKVNWNLRVLGKCGDGYHEIESLVSSVTLADDLQFELRPAGVFALHVDHPQVPVDGSNLVVKAARLLAERSNCCRGMACLLTKRVPVGGGLGGGSSNAGRTLVALNQLWSLGWSSDQLRAVGAEVGSDVSFFVDGGSAVIRGRGERIQPVELGWRGWIVLVLPSFGMSTAAVYAAWRPGAAPSTSAAMRPCKHAAEWMAQTFNMLEEPAMSLRPLLREMRDHLSQLAGRTVRMSGSGSTLFTAFDSRDKATAFADRAHSDLDAETRVVEPVGNA